MAEFNIYFSDLNEVAQKQLLDFYGFTDPSEGNWDSDIIPICVLMNDEEEIINGLPQQFHVISRANHRRTLY